MTLRLVAVSVAFLALSGAATADVGPLAPSYPTVSPDGSRIAWVDGFSWKIWVSAPDGSGAHVVASAPTGEGISAMHWTSQGLVVDSDFALYLIRPGRKARLVAKDGGFAFAAGGARVATGLERAPGQYVVTDLVSGRHWRFGSSKAVNNNGALAADGSRVAWSGPGGIWIARLGGQARRLAAEAACPSWSPDGTRIAFMRTADLRVVSASGGRSRLLARRVGGCQATAWSPDSSTVAYSAPRGLILVDARSGTVRSLPRSLGETWGGAWLPDGSTLYALSRPPRDEGSNCLNLVRLDPATMHSDVVVHGCP